MQYLRGLPGQILPGWKYPDDIGASDARFFDDYRQAIGGLASYRGGPDNYSPAVLAASQRIYDSEAARRESINTRCGAVLSTGGVLGALFVAAGQLGLSRQKGSFGAVAWLELIVFSIALIYLGVSIAMALAVQGSRQGSLIDPRDVSAGTGQTDINSYDMYLARKYLEYTVDNYASNNRLKFRLHSAQRHLRNGIIAIIVAGILSPLALHSTTTSTASGPPPSTPVAVGPHITPWT
jgi:hypothetical protein